MRSLFVLLLLSTQVWAQQLQLSVTGNQIDYHWQDANSQSHKITLRLPKTDINQLQYHSYDRHAAETYIFYELKKFAQNLQSADIKLEFYREQALNKIDIKAKSTALLITAKQQLIDKQAALYASYLDNNNYIQFINAAGERMIKPDHRKIAALSTSSLQPLADAFAAQLTTTDPREGISKLLSFVQSIPYDSLQSVSYARSRIDPSAEPQPKLSFLTPLDVLRYNLGDCDSKATLLGAMLKSLYPELSMAMVFIPQHALLAIDIPGQDAELTISVGNKDYIMLDATGPALMKMGQVQAQTAMHLTKNAFTLEPWH